MKNGILKDQLALFGLSVLQNFHKQNTEKLKSETQKIDEIVSKVPEKITKQLLGGDEFIERRDFESDFDVENPGYDIQDFMREGFQTITKFPIQFPGEGLIPSFPAPTPPPDAGPAPIPDIICDDFIRRIGISWNETFITIGIVDLAKDILANALGQQLTGKEEQMYINIIENGETRLIQLRKQRALLRHTAEEMGCNLPDFIPPISSK